MSVAEEQKLASGHLREAHCGLLLGIEPDRQNSVVSHKRNEFYVVFLCHFVAKFNIVIILYFRNTNDVL